MEQIDEEIIKRTVKDSVFTNLFREKEYLLQLYRVLHPEDKNVSEDDLSDITIENILTNALYNDLGFRVRNKLIILVEAQSTWTMNILLRFGMYIFKTYKDILENTKQNVYGKKKVVLPRPEFYVVYPKKAGKHRKCESISLSAELWNGEKTSLEITAKVLYNGKKGDILYQYVMFTQICDDIFHKYGRTREAMIKILQICQDRDVLKKYLLSREGEVIDMVLYNAEEIMEKYVNDRVETAVKHAVKHAEREASIRTKIETCQEFGLSRKDTALKIKKAFRLSDSAARKKMGKYWIK